MKTVLYAPDRMYGGLTGIQSGGRKRRDLKTKVVKGRPKAEKKTAPRKANDMAPKVTWRGWRRAIGNTVRVEWLINIDHDKALPTDRAAQMQLAVEGASSALNMHRNHHSSAAYFTVTLPDGATFNVDLATDDR